MSSDFLKVMLADLCTDVSYGYTASSISEPVGPKFLRITDIQGGAVDWASVPYCEASESAKRKNKLERGDIVIARTGNSTGENYIFESNEDTVFASYLIRFRVNPALANPYFVWLQLRTQAWWDYVSGSKSGSAQAGANAKVLGCYELNLPDRKVQNKIELIFRKLNEKNQVNQQISQTLEQMAQAIFKSWFVDFEPVKAKVAALEAGGSEDDALLAAMQVISGKDPQQLTQLQTENPEHYTTLRTTAELFPNSLIESELGDIPEGWENFKMIDLVSQIKPGTNYQPKRQEGGIPFVNGKHVQDGFLDFSKGIKYITQEEYERVHKSWKPEVNDVLITRIGTLGRVAIVTKHDLPMAVHYNSIIIKEGVIKHPFIFFLLRSDYFQHFYHLYKKQAVQEFVTIDAVEGIQVCLPIKKSVLNGLTKIFDEFLFKLRVNHCESNTLAQLRDALLPKLLSGELSVNQDFD